MPSQLILQLAGGLAVSGAVWLLTRRVLQTLDAKQTEVARRASAPLLPSEANRRADASDRARLVFERLVSSVDGGAAVRSVAASPSEAPPAKAMETPARPVRPTPQEILAKVLANVASTQVNKTSPTADPSVDPEQTIPATGLPSDLSVLFIREGENTASGSPVNLGAVPPSAPPPPPASRTPDTDQALRAFTLNPTPQSQPTVSINRPSPPNVGRPLGNAGPSAAVELAAWIPAGAEARVGGTRITGGMIYVGENLPNPQGWGMDRCLINPSLRVARTVAADDISNLNYWPDYAGLSPSRRRAYVEWLASGRSDPQADVGLVFLFFYGLERRLFFDRVVADAPILTAEVERLLDIYGSHGSFRGYASTFQAAAALVSGKPAPEATPSPIPNWSDELPLTTRLYLGGVLSRGGALTADDALMWVLGANETRLRTPGQRCFEEVRSVFSRQFSSRHPRGLAVRTPQRRISVSYRAASDTFTAPISGPHETLPDISAITAPLAGLRDMLEASQTELEPYSRLLGRRPEARGSLEAAMLLPPGLREGAMAEAGEAARQTVASLLGSSSMASVPPRVLLEAVGIPLERDAVRLPGGIALQLQQRLDALGFGMEPDRRYGGEAISMSSDIILFETADGAVVEPERPAFALGKAAMEVAALAASTDGEVSDVEFQALLREAQSMPDLSPAETIRLKAFVWRLRERTKSGGALKKAADLPPAARQAIARAAISAVLADGQASRAEVAFLEKLHKTLGLPPEDVHRALHEGASGDHRPPRPVPPIQSGVAPGQPGIALDAERMARIRQETTQVASLLSSIFDEEAEATVDAAPSTPEPTGGTGKRFEGLDDAHGALLDAIIAAEPMPTAAFEAEAKRLRLFPDGAIETINDWAFERFEEPLLENDDDVVMVAEHLRSELPAA